MVRYLLCACLVLAGCSSTKSVASNKVYTDEPVMVSCQGRNFEEAKKQCFDNAIEYAVGAVVVSDTEVRNKILAKNEILKHSSGYVDSYNIVHQSNDPNNVSISMSVLVRSSKIAERILSTATSTGSINGEKLSTQYNTYKETRDTGDALLKKVLSSYPKNAYNIKQVGKVNFQLDKDRNVYIIVPFEIRWNYNFLTALNEVLAITADGGKVGYAQDLIMVESKDPKAWILGTTDKFYFNDRSRVDMVQKKFIGRITANIVIKNKQGRPVFIGCQDAFHHGTNLVYPYVVRGTEVVEDQFTIKVNSRSPKLKELDTADTIELSYSATSCYNYEQ